MRRRAFLASGATTDRLQFVTVAGPDAVEVPLGPSTPEMVPIGPTTVIKDDIGFIRPA